MYTSQLWPRQQLLPWQRCCGLVRQQQAGVAVRCASWWGVCSRSAAAVFVQGCFAAAGLHHSRRLLVGFGIMMLCAWEP